jgi:hypothetical protein
MTDGDRVRGRSSLIDTGRASSLIDLMDQSVSSLIETQLIASRKDVERGNRRALRAADAGGAATKSARKSRTETNLDASDVEQEASSSQTGKRKRRRYPAEAKATADAPTPPSAAESGDRASDPGPTKHGKPGKRRRRKGKAEKDHE